VKSEDSAKQAVSNKVINPGLLFNPLIFLKEFVLYFLFKKFSTKSITKWRLLFMLRTRSYGLYYRMLSLFGRYSYSNNWKIGSKNYFEINVFLKGCLSLDI